MILELIFNLISGLLKIVFGLLPDLPNLPETVIFTISEYINLICENISFLGFFIDVSYAKIIIALLITMIGFRQLYHFAMFVYRKLPISSE